MNRLVIIGNGFDMAHGLKTSYMDFINWYWDTRVADFAKNTSIVSKDTLCELTITDTKKYSSWQDFSSCNSSYREHHKPFENFGSLVFEHIKQDLNSFSIENCKLFETILQSKDAKGWVDIENDYYKLLKDCVGNSQSKYTVI